MSVADVGKVRMKLMSESPSAACLNDDRVQRCGRGGSKRLTAAVPSSGPSASSSTPARRR